MLLESENLRSYVDPATNAMLVSDLDPASYLAWLKGRPVAGSKLLANFLHEWTHRWCFDSRLGAALALLRLRAGCRTLQGKSAFDDYVRCMTGTVMLEPLAEGLALFAEFDAYPGESSWMSQTLCAASIFFSPALDMEGRVMLLLEGLLQRLRRDPELLERKAGIYCLAASNPYSLGYLSVKGLWYQMRARCATLSDLDLFLSYLRSYIYDDPGLAIAILEPARDELRAAEKIANRVIARCRELLAEAHLDERVELWIESAHTGVVAAEAINASEQDAEKSNTLLNQALVEDAGDPKGLEIAAWRIMTLEERTLCVLGTTP